MFFNGKEVKAAIFDMDGTMFDTEKLRFSTLKQASLQIFGEPITDEVLYGSLGLSAKRAEALAQSHFGEKYPYRAIRKRADELELAYVRKYGVPVKQGLYDVLERLKKNGILIALATSSRRAIAEEYLLSAKVLKYFDVTVCGDEVINGKPHPEIFLTAASEINCAPQECLMLEDSANGLRAATAAEGLAVYILDIKHPPEDIRERAFACYDSMQDFLNALTRQTPHLPVPRLTDAFPITRNHYVAGIHGFGAIGGGYLSQIFSHWDGYTRPHRIIGVTGNALIKGVVNSFGKFRVRYPDSAFDQTIEHVEIIASTDEEAVCQMYVQAEIVGMCLPETAIKPQAALIAKALHMRAQEATRPLVILVLMNKVGCAAFVKKAVQEALRKAHGREEADAALAHVHFVETVVNRIVTRIPKDVVLRQIKVSFGEFEKRIINQPLYQGSSIRQLIGSKAFPADTAMPLVYEKMAQISDLASAVNQLNVGLFHSGPDMLLYAQKGSAILERLCQVKVVDDITAIQAIKNRLLNGTHAILAWYASLLGYTTIGQGMGDERVKVLVRRLANQEVKQTILKESPAMAEHANTFMNNFLLRCRASFKDPCRRVGRDPMRKLQSHERIFGSIRSAQRLNIPTPMLEFGAALGLVYAMKAAPETDKESQHIKARLAQGHTVADILAYEGMYAGKPYSGLSRTTDADLLNRIAWHFERLKDPDSPHWEWPMQYDVDKHLN